MTVVHTLGELVSLARKHEIKPGIHDGKLYYTLVIRDGKMVELTAATKDDYARAIEKSPKGGKR